MKGSATIIGSISGRAIVCQPCQGTAAAERTREAGLLSWIRVLPEQPQELVWLTPQVGIDYDIHTSSGLDWHIL